MNTKRRAELQRKLTLNAVPRPPAGLVERIKADIPKYLQPETAPQRLSRTLAFPMRIAASFLLVAGAVVIAMTMVRGPQRKVADTAERPVIFAPAPRAVAPADHTSTTSVARTEEVQLDIVQEAEPIVAPQIASAHVAPPRLAPPTLEEQPFEEDAPASAREEVESGVEAESTGVAGGVVGGVAGDLAAEAEPQRIAELVPEPPMPPAAPLPAAAPVMAPPPAAAAPAFEDARLERKQERAAAKTTLAAAPRQRADAQDSFFGISVRPQVFNDIRAALESGQRPAASAVDVEALVNYFAGAPSRRPRKVHLEVEASPAALPAEGDRAVLRFTVDTPAGTGIAASDARIEIEFNDETVARAERIGDAEPLARASVLPNGTSVTGLYALQMKPGLRSSQVIATVRLHFTVNGEPDTRTATVKAGELLKGWQRSTRRHRLASLGALWAESLKGSVGGGADVAKRAEELATQEPGDVRARELARAASASAAGGR